MEQQIQELVTTIQQLRDTQNALNASNQELRAAQANLAAENQVLREGQAGIQVLAQSVGELAQQLKKDPKEKKILMDTKGLGKPEPFDNKEDSFRRCIRSINNLIAGVFGNDFEKVLETCLDTEDPIDVKDLVDNQHPDVDNIPEVATHNAPRASLPVVPTPQLVVGFGLTRLSRYHQNTMSSCGALFWLEPKVGVCTAKTLDLYNCTTWEYMGYTYLHHENQNIIKTVTKTMRNRARLYSILRAQSIARHKMHGTQSTQININQHSASQCRIYFKELKDCSTQCAARSNSCHSCFIWKLAPAVTSSMEHAPGFQYVSNPSLSFSNFSLFAIHGLWSFNTSKYLRCLGDWWNVGG